MKKLLALVLALVMSLSLVTISNAAFDAEEISYNEAVDVLNALGVIKGDEKGNFNATTELDRQSAAKIIAYLDLGEEVAEALPAVKVFNDVPADHWAAKYIAYCYDAGYILGTGDGNFNPTGKLTGYAFAKMLLCVLGYDQSIEKMTGSAWEIAVAKLMKSNDIADGVSKNASAVLTREEAAQYALNALKAETVGYETSGTVIEGNGLTITTGSSKADAKNGEGKLYEKLYGEDVTYLENVEDAFGRDAVKWSYKDFDGTYATGKADYTYYGSVSGKTLYNDLGLKTSKTYTVDGKSMTGSAIKAMDDLGGFNCIVEVNYDSEDKTIDTITVEYEIAKVTKVNEVNKNRDERSVVIAGKTYETESFAKNDYVLYTYKDGEFQDVQLAETVEGKITSVKSNKLTIEGVTYKFDDTETTLKGLTAKSEGTFYLGVDGAIIYATDVDAATTSDKYAYVYKINAASSSDEYDEDGYKLDNGNGTAYYVDANGVKGSAPIADEETFKAGDVIPYTINKDGEIEKAEYDEDEVIFSGKFNATIGKSQIEDEDASYLASSSTKFVFVKNDETDKKLTVSVATGYKNIEDQDASVFVISDDANKAEVVFVFAKAETAADDAVYAFLVDETPEITWDEDEEDYIYTYTVLIDGEEEELSTYSEDGFMAGVKEGQRFSYVLKDGMLDDDVEVQKADAEGEIKAIVDNYIKIGNKTYEIADDAEVYNNSDADELFVGDVFEEGDTVLVYSNGKDADDDDFAYVAVVITKEAVED